MSITKGPDDGNAYYHHADLGKHAIFGLAVADVHADKGEGAPWSAMASPITWPPGWAMAVLWNEPPVIDTAPSSAKRSPPAAPWALEFANASSSVIETFPQTGRNG